MTSATSVFGTTRYILRYNTAQMKTIHIPPFVSDVTTSSVIFTLSGPVVPPAEERMLFGVSLLSLLVSTSVHLELCPAGTYLGATSIVYSIA